MLFRAGILLFLVMIAYIPACQGGFIWDDNRYVSENLALRRPGGLSDIWFFPTATPQYYPMVFTSFWLEYRVWRLNPAGYHWANVILHGLNAGLLYYLLRQLRIPFPWFAAAIFALHPVHVESVAWITERKNVLSGFFYLIAFLAYLRFSPLEEEGEKGRKGEGEKGRKGNVKTPSGPLLPFSPSPLLPFFWYALSLLAYLAALFSKTVTCSLPAVLVLVYWWKRGWPTRREMIALAPMFAAGLVLSMHTAKMEHDFIGATGEDWAFTPIERCLIAGRALWFYVGKLLWPYPLIFNYERWHIDAHQPWQYLYPLACLAVLGILAWPLTRLPLPKLLAPLRYLGKGPLTACLIFAGTLLPALGFVNVYPMLYYFVADHFQYLASIAIICLAMGAIKVGLAARGGDLSSPLAPRPSPLYLPAGAYLIVLGCLTWTQSYVYHDLESLWGHTRTMNPEAWMAHYNYGRLQVEMGNLDLAIESFKRTTEIDPRCASAYNNWGFALCAQAAEAETIAKETDNQALAAEQRVLAKQKFAIALEKVKLAVEYDRENNPTILYHLATIYGTMEDYDSAAANFALALEAATQPGRKGDMSSFVPNCEYYLALALFKAGRRSEALPHAQRAAELRPDQPGFQQFLEEVRRPATRHTNPKR